ncbi:MAG: hypothetical protein SCH98_01565 [Deferrisomatales bacterium]|nr:hypothetical protein [Deferrisomatales bacterium]
MAKKDVLTETTERMTAGVAAQAELASKFFALYQTQAEGALKFWTDTSANAMAEGQKAVKEWVDLAAGVAAEARKSCEVSIKEATKVFTPPA